MRRKLLTYWLLLYVWQVKAIVLQSLSRTFKCSLKSSYCPMFGWNLSPICTENGLVLLSVKNRERLDVMCHNTPASLSNMNSKRSLRKWQTSWFWVKRLTWFYFGFKFPGSKSATNTSFWVSCDKFEFGLRNGEYLSYQVGSWCFQCLKCEHIVCAQSSSCTPGDAIKSASSLFSLRIFLCCMSDKSHLFMGSS